MSAGFSASIIGITSFGISGKSIIFLDCSIGASQIADWLGSNPVDIINFIGDFRLYIRPDQFPPDLIEGANILRETIAREALEKGHTTQEMLNNINSIKIKYPSDGNTTKFLLQTAYQEGTNNPSYRCMMRT